MNHFYRDVPGLGHVAISRHAQQSAADDNITEAEVERALFNPTAKDVPQGNDILIREARGVRLVILLHPTPNRGARLVKTIMRVQAQARAVRK
jgi:hypothetical protein